MIENKITYLNNVQLSVDKGLIYTRLGYKKTSTLLNTIQKEFMEKSIHKGLSLCKPKAAYTILKIVEKNDNYVILENNIKFESKKLSMFLDNAVEVILMAGTVGEQIYKEISFNIQNENASLGLILDAVGSEAADNILDYVMTFLNRVLPREGKKLSKNRFSPGYGDLQLFNQKYIFKTLDLQKLGLELTDKFILIPEKSVLAIAGVELI